MIDRADDRAGLTAATPVRRFDGDEVRDTVDDVATEEPLEIRIVDGATTTSIAVTMRTPGHDLELAAGFLYSEGAIAGSSDIATLSYCIDPAIDAAQRYNIVNVGLAPGARIHAERLERHFTINSACGVCGKANIDALATRAKPLADDVRVPASAISALPVAMRDAQRVFASTGGLHAAALFDAHGKLLALREDVGRHNAVDKIAGWALLNGRLPLRGCILQVSGRASFELVQKCIVAGIPVLSAVSAPSSLAVQLAREFNLTLLGFVRAGRANAYSAPERILAG